MAHKDIFVLGISADYHDSAAVLIKNGVVVAAAQEERFTRKKHDEEIPANAIKYCLDFSSITPDRLDYAVYYEKPLLKFERLIEMYLNSWPKGLISFLRAMSSMFAKKLWVEKRLKSVLPGYTGSIYYSKHHKAHAASAYYPSGFSEAVILTMDGVGEYDTTTISVGRGNRLQMLKSLSFPHSLGLLYSALTYYLGFKVNSAEYKVMGLAPYGNPANYYDKLKSLVDVKTDGGIELDMSFFSYHYGLTMTNDKFDRLFGGKPRAPESPLSQKEKDIAAALQQLTNEIVLKMAQYAKNISGMKNLCMAGGVALNCVANGKILAEKIFDNIYIQPAAGDAGGALGAALNLYYNVLDNPMPGNDISVMPDVYLGPEYGDQELKNFLDCEVPRLFGGEKRVSYERLEDNELAERASGLITGNNVIGWFQGRMEFGPRALGNRSIIADPRNAENWKKVNLKIKFRESFRPFAPSVLAEKASEYFDLAIASPYMLLVAPVLKSNLPAITHVDGSARIQTVRQSDNPKYYELIQKFFEKTGCPVVINTSFNIRGEPIVMSPADAFNTFLNTFMDYLVLGNYLISKQTNLHLVDQEVMHKYLNQFNLD